MNMFSILLTGLTRCMVLWFYGSIVLCIVNVSLLVVSCSIIIIEVVARLLSRLLASCTIIIVNCSYRDTTVLARLIALPENFPHH